MNKSLATLTLILFCFIGRAQSVSKTDLTGKWQVTSALMSDTKDSPEIMEKMDVLRKCYENAIIDFKEDGNFFIEFKKNNPKEFTDILYEENSYWKYDASTSIISIGTIEEDYSFMEMKIVQKSDVTYFLIAESPYALVVQKL